MDCSLIQIDLVAYHLGAIEEPARERVEAHLVECAACVRAYITLKRHSEAGAARPSYAAKMRLRAAVSAEFETSPRARIRKWMRRPIPLYQGIAAAALIAIAALSAPQVARLFARTPPAEMAGGERVDTARPSPDSLSFY
jgi:anti-sigma factor RsiW